jgi:uncharacterized protein (DUF1697 family)
MNQCVALIRGINVGRARRVAMADLRALMEKLGYTDVRTLLNSGNIVFKARRSSVEKQARAIEAAIARTFGFSASIVVMPAADLAAIVKENPLHAIAKDSTKYFVGFVSNRTALLKVKPLLDKSWKPDVIAIGAKAAYLWCANGLIDSKLMHAFARATGEQATTRNWATVLKLHAAANRIEHAT